VILVDQSTNDATERAVEDLRHEPRFSYLRSSTVGLSRARNIGLRAAQTDVVAFTDDDCEVPEDWAAAMQSIFSEFPDVAIAFCSVKAGPFAEAAGFVPAYECRGTRIVDRVIGKCGARGIGAGLAVSRKAMLDVLGGFDEMLGAGGSFPSCEDGDAAVRALLAGFQVCETDRSFVLHHGFRTWDEGRALSQRDWVGIGAAYAKPLRAGRWDFSPVPLYELLAKALWPPIDDVLHLRKPRGLARGYHFLRGFAMGCRTPLDYQKLLFIPQ
jgi:glycosyltransferase involved in cell wall biosynthesis